MVDKTYKINVQEVPRINSENCWRDCVFASTSMDICSEIKCLSSQREDKRDVYFIAKSISEQEPES